MLLELFITMQLLALVCFGIGFFRKSEWFWSFSLIITGILIFSSYNIEQNVSIITSQTMVGNTITYQHDIVSKQVIDTTYSYFNMGMFLIGLLLFVNDLFMNWKDNKSAKRSG